MKDGSGSSSLQNGIFRTLRKLKGKNWVIINNYKFCGDSVLELLFGEIDNGMPF